MIRRIAALSVALTFAASTAVWADEPSGESVVVPPPVMEEEAVEEPVTAPPPPYVALEHVSIGAGIGLSWGEGVLGFEGERHAFSVRGLGLGDLGVARLLSEGTVSNLAALADFEGHYVAVEAGAAAGVGASVLRMRNQHGVVIQLKSEVEGVQLAIGPDGFRITLD